MIAILIGIAIKSLIIAGAALGLLALLKRRSAAERSWVAHVGLLALVVLALAPLALPRWSVEAPIFSSARTDHSVTTTRTSTDAPLPSVATKLEASAPRAATTAPRISSTAIATAAYALPALLLLIVTLVALFRLVALRARADVLVDSHWLSALARAQRRMGFKHGTALLTSNDLASPISWGLMRPVILLNARAVEASGEAEAIIAHELAHVARMDWIKLLLARVATALFWFNPLVWMLAREAHQLREEAADDSVLAADICDTDYAQLLVGVARHECPGLLLGAHGVAPSKSSLARRVARVLDGKSVRGPVARSFAMGVLAGAVLVAAPLAALTLTPAKPSTRNGQAASLSGPSAHYYEAEPAEAPGDLPSIIASGISAAVAAVGPEQAAAEADVRRAAIGQALAGARTAVVAAHEVADDARAAARKRAIEADEDDRIDKVIDMHVLGISADYVNAMRAVSPRLRDLDPSEFTGMKAVGVTPEYARALAAAGFRNLDEDELTSARAVGLSPDYAQALSRAGLRPDIDDYIQLRAVGVPASYVASLRASGRRVPDADRIVDMWAVGVRAEEFGAPPTSRPPAWPRVPGPAAPPTPPASPGQDTGDDDG